MLISQGLCLKCPWASFVSDFILSHFQLSFFSPFCMSSCQEDFDLGDMLLLYSCLWQSSHLPLEDNSTETH